MKKICIFFGLLSFSIALHSAEVDPFYCKQLATLEESIYYIKSCGLSDESVDNIHNMVKDAFSIYSRIKKACVKYSKCSDVNFKHFGVDEDRIELTREHYIREKSYRALLITAGWLAEKIDPKVYIQSHGQLNIFIDGLNDPHSLDSDCAQTLAKIGPHTKLGQEWADVLFKPDKKPQNLKTSCCLM